MRINNIVILLTACVNPDGMAYTALQDKTVRLKQYREALDWYLAHVKNKIVFVENTGYDISPLYENYIAAGQLEVLTFHGNDFDKSKGKGYGEALIVEYALNHSEFLKQNDNIIKITGRLICGNVQKMLRHYEDKGTLYGLRMQDDEGKDEINSQVIVAPYIYWKDFFISDKEKINDSRHYWFEHLLYDAKNKWVNDGYRFKEMWMPLKLQGLSGSTGNTVSAPALNNPLSFYLHYILHRLGYYGPITFRILRKKS